MVKIMNHQKRLSRHNSRQSSIGETASVCSAKSVKSNGSSDYNPSTTTTTTSSSLFGGKKHQNGLAKHASQDSGDSGNGGSQPAAILNVAEMLLHGVADHEILNIWLRKIDCEEFVGKFLDAGYDMPTISRITPQDLTAIGVTDPNKRMTILAEIKKLNLPDGIPNFMPSSLSHWLSLIRLDSFYYKSLCDQQVDTIEKLCQLTWEDFEELGITKLGHQKRFQLAIERIKELEEDAKSSTKHLSEPIYDVNPSQILLVASAENHSMNGPIINKQSSTSELSSTGSGSMHSVYSAASTQYQSSYGPMMDNNQQQMIGLNNVPNTANLNHSPQQQAMFNQGPPPPPQPMIYQQPPLMNGGCMQPQQQSHYHQVNPVQQMSMQFAYSNNNNNNINNDSLHLSNARSSSGQMNPQQNRQSMSQLPFAALARLPKHQQQILQQSSIYATLRRQPSRQNKQPPPPVPIRTNSLKTNSMTDETYSCQQPTHITKNQQQQPVNNHGLSQQPPQPSIMQPQPQMPSMSQQQQPHQQYPMTPKQPFFQDSYLPPPPINVSQTSSTSHFPQNPTTATTTTTTSTNGVAPTHCNATTGRDEDFPPPPSPLSITDSDEHELVSTQNSDTNFTDVGHGMMTFRIGT